MNTEAYVDLLRKTLVRNGFILQNTASQAAGPKILQHGEWLVSLMSHDAQLRDYLIATCNSEDFARSMGLEGDIDTGYLFSGWWKESVTLWVDAVRFTWLVHGAAFTLNFVKSNGLYLWSFQELRDRQSYVDDLVVIAQKRLRQSGMKYSEMAEFFASPEAVALLQCEVFGFSSSWH